MRRKETGRRVQGKNAARQVHDPPEARRSKTRRSSEEASPALSREVESIRTWLKQVRFQKTVFGGVDEADVWKKIGELNTLYEQALAAERMRYDALLAERSKSADHVSEAQMRTDLPEKAGDVCYE